MDFPIIDKSKGDETQVDPMAELLPLKWSALELRTMLNEASSKLEESVRRQRLCNARIRKTIDLIMSYESKYSECKEERQAMIEKIKALRLEDDDAVSDNVESDAEEIVSRLVEVVCMQEESPLKNEKEGLGDFRGVNKLKYEEAPGRL